MNTRIYSIELIGSGSLSVMDKPVAGEWLDESMAAIAQSGISQIVSFLERSESWELGLDKEAELAERHGMEFVSYPIPDRGLPASMTDYLALTKRLYHHAAGGEHIVIHCRAGIGRTGMVAAGVLLHCGFEPDEALEHISLKRGVTVPDTDEQIEWLSTCYAAM